jgi:hypothetical protein
MLWRWDNTRVIAHRTVTKTTSWMINGRLAFRKIHIISGSQGLVGTFRPKKT